MTIPDIFGQLRSSIVVTLLVRVEPVYEIKINKQYYKERILFFPSNSESSIVLTFYFDKQNEADYTNVLAKETEEIYSGRTLT